MKQTTRYIILGIAVVLIVGVIVLLESQNAHHTSVNVGADVAVPTNDGSLGTTGTSTPGTASSTTGTIGAAGAGGVVHSANYAANKLIYPPAKELVSPDGYINTGGKPITIGGLLGKKVILVDFWTYSCINCQRTIPYLEAWYQKYQNSGFVIIGVHTPEFAFEKVLANVQAGVTKFGITYPVALDSNYNTWDAYGNNYWPEEYLIDIDGLVREHNIGEGNYTETEQNIQKLLAERNKTLGLTAPIPTGLVNVTSSINTSSPESYFDWARNGSSLGNGNVSTPGQQTFTAPDQSAMSINKIYLDGGWNIGQESAVNTTDGAKIYFKYNSQNVYFVASANPAVSITVLRDGVPVAAQKGADVDSSGNAAVSTPRLYKLIAEPSQSSHTIEIIVHGTGLNAFTFTFG